MSKKLNPKALPWVPKLNIQSAATDDSRRSVPYPTTRSFEISRRGCNASSRVCTSITTRESNFDPQDLMNKICKIGKELKNRDEDLARDLLRQFNERDHDGLTKLLEDFRELLSSYKHVDVIKLCNEQMCKLCSIIYT